MHGIPKQMICALAAIILPAAAMAADEPIATVNGVAISRALAEIFAAQAMANGMSATPDMTGTLRKELIVRELAFQAAQAAGFDKRPQVAAEADAAVKRLQLQAEATRQTIVTRAYLDDYLKRHPVTDAELKRTYETYRAKGGNTEYKARHILLADEAAAKAVIDRLDGGATFEELASQSLDGVTRARGGDLGWSSRTRYAKPFGDALAKLGKGHYSSKPVKTEFGYHVIWLEDSRPLTVPSFTNLKNALRKDAESARLKQHVESLRAGAKIQY
ncbi:MAG: peptidylprolyl isomerase [Candidatus Dactylopiibacterium carminicum]|uniref:peptidylprolyl isomerase n=1 Tax=Candidatus Dactylopiibacterium carminicum TaxID=857335 RepID=A0A272ETF2_9RHOO|nr:peptidylprolyl isomerase [Candidatus Dactylopiibacterium carminicum]KAF7599369.1 peptidylprolyl isomerase [Candidatus Dactylopiibacterium carminicum]PAS93379.1 MAG: peptidylprolyl isomerase [Candidatus Dactylopiibacterium carminicum]PAS98332.1 MAG: peptidylprolyl isomerase [Candidatus Dactylopiibacterium carminicum]PAS99378.1 MAG: hypothetical protein BSR46_08415 [Candidatus Dactylopiibacterium carminicum]